MSSREAARQHRTLAQEQYKRGQYLEVMQSADKVSETTTQSWFNANQIGPGTGISRSERLRHQSCGFKQAGGTPRWTMEGLGLRDNQAHVSEMAQELESRSICNRD